MRYLNIEHNGKQLKIFAERIHNTVWFHVNGQVFQHDYSAKSRRHGQQKAGDGQIMAPMPGKIIKVNVEPDSVVKQGDCLVVLEAMKMEYNLCADMDGKVSALNCKEGEQVKTSVALVELAKDE